MMMPSAPGTTMKISKGNAQIDYSNITEGYVVVTYLGDKTKKCFVRINGHQKFTIFHPDRPDDKTTKVIPLCDGNKTYTFEVFRQEQATSYRTILTLSVDVVLTNPLSPWLYPNTYCDYNEQSVVINLSDFLSGKSISDAVYVVEAVDWMCDNLEYDKELAAFVSKDAKWYIPCPDEVIANKKDICFGYSSLLAALCRIQGIPCKIVIGWAGAARSYHAWNEVYLDGQWLRFDVTYEDAGHRSYEVMAFIANTKNYVMDYCG